MSAERSTPSVPRWTHHHTFAACQDPTCNWTRDYHGQDSNEAQLVLQAARRHRQRWNHYVQVERGEHIHYDAVPE